MSIQYQAVGWNRQKKLYDGLLALGVLLYLAVFVLLHVLAVPNAPIETVLIRGFGTAALILLHIILMIGPLCRLDPRSLPLLYNRRHMGVTMFVLGLAHGVLAIVQFHALGSLNPLVSVFVSHGGYAGIASFPFQPLGFAALVILFLMAATSHDFWLTNLSAPMWKRIHMLVYFAYALLIAHVALGVLQAETSPVFVGLMAVGFALILGLHLMTGFREASMDKALAEDSEWVDVCDVADIEEKRARIVCLAGERIAVFRYDGKISAVSNVCQHQNGPLGEGKIIDGCITCPWHGYQYRPHDGTSPPPFTEKIPTFEVRIQAGRVWVNPTPNQPGTHVEPAIIEV